jgi:hypothetical protein
MKHLIFTSEQSCLSRIEQINDFLRPEWVDGITNNYAEPRKHPTEDKWALVVEQRYEHAFTAEELAQAVELTEDWNPKIDFLNEEIK